MATKKKTAPKKKKKDDKKKPKKSSSSKKRGGHGGHGHHGGGGHHGGDDDGDGGGKGPLTPQNNPGDATTTPVASYTQLDGYWNLMRNVYRPVIVQVDSRSGTVIEFFILSPDDGQPFDDGGGPALFEVDLDNGDDTYPYFPSTAQQITLPSSNDVGYLLLSCEYLDDALGGDVDDYAGDKMPPGCSL
ncbi:MAG: hypothetical protein ACO1OB_32805 [Archangium sp.]